MELMKQVDDVLPVINRCHWDTDCIDDLCITDDFEDLKICLILAFKTDVNLTERRITEK